MVDCAEVEQLLGAYALDALTPGELEDVEQHLESCASCRDDVTDAERVAAVLRLGVPQIDPPGHLRARVLNAARLQPLQSADAPQAPARGVASGSGRGRVVPLVWAAAAALIPLLLSGWLTMEVVSLQRSADAMRASEREAWIEAQGAAEIAARGVQVGAGAAQIEATEYAPTAWGTFYYIPRQTDGVLVVGGLPALPRDKCYQVWLISGDTTMNGGTFYLEGEGRGMLVVKSPMPMDDVDTVRVTMEPHGGSSEPQGDRYLWARLKGT